MKKLLVLALVLGLTAMSSASMLYFGVQGVTGTELQAETSYIGQIIFDDTTADTFNDTSFRAAISLAGATTWAAGTLNGVLTGGIPRTGTVYNPPVSGMYIGRIEGSTGASGPYMTDNMVLYTFSFTTGASGTVTLDDVAMTGIPPWGGAPTGYNTKFNTTVVDMAAATYNVVPEPVTMGLLALGGLFIRRKK